MPFLYQCMGSSKDSHALEMPANAVGDLGSLANEMVVGAHTLAFVGPATVLDEIPFASSRADNQVRAATPAFEHSAEQVCALRPALDLKTSYPGIAQLTQIFK